MQGAGYGTWRRASTDITRPERRTGEAEAHSASVQSETCSETWAELGEQGVDCVPHTRPGTKGETNEGAGNTFIAAGLFGTAASGIQM